MQLKEMLRQIKPMRWQIPLMLLGVNFLFFKVAFSIAFSEEEHFENTIISSGLLTNEIEINYYINNQKIGFVSYNKIPLFNFYIMHSFYIYPAYRNKGYGKKLIKYVCEYLKTINAKRVYIQPGPFEINDDIAENINDSSRDSKIQKLIKLYSEQGFHFVDSITAFFASIGYKIVGIPENANYLMVRKF